MGNYVNRRPTEEYKLLLELHTSMDIRIIFIYLSLTDVSITKENPLCELFMLFDMCTPQYISTRYF